MRHEALYQLFLTGIKSLGVITVVALFTGMILALQTGLELRRFGQEVNIGTAVTVVMMREMGPFMTALIIAASVGSAIAAQLGTQAQCQRGDQPAAHGQTMHTTQQPDGQSGEVHLWL